jgi:hypothetical protein
MSLNEYQKRLVETWAHSPGPSMQPMTTSELSIILLLSELTNYSESSIKLRLEGLRTAIERHRHQLEQRDGLREPEPTAEGHGGPPRDRVSGVRPLDPYRQTDFGVLRDVQAHPQARGSEEG